MKRISLLQLLMVSGLAATTLWAVLAEAGKPAGDQQSETAEATRAEEKDSQPEEKPYVPKSDRELRRTLSKMQYEVTQKEATEPAFRNRYWDNKQKGVYRCIVCDRELFTSNTKYKSGTGWPSFFAPIRPKTVGYRVDYKLFYARTEVHCARCKAHLGHVFDDGPRPTGKRYCMNSASLKFVSEKDLKEKEKGSEDKE